MTTAVDTILTEYKTMHLLYNEFSNLMGTLLEEMLKKEHCKYHISSRVKEINSLSEKIERKGKIGVVYRHLQDIEDTVGVRIVFYTDIDKKRFIRKIKKEFAGSLRIEKAKGKHGYSSTHIIVTLGERRSQLTEYKKFKSLKCEIQLTCMLDHAWAELEHDILYKTSNNLYVENRQYYDSLKTRMEKIMSEHIKRASSELETISKEIKRIHTAKSKTCKQLQGQLFKGRE